MSSLCQIKCEYWGKVHYMERDQIVAKFYILSPQILVNNSNTQYNGKM